MRRLLIRLVALETALVGWLGYWLFLLYANNSGISEGLASQLGRFPQLSFTTVDIAMLTLIAGVAIFLAYKFQKGLKPGIRLERALQMLEGMMKRNLVLEAQVAEIKMEKANIPLPAPTGNAAEPRQGSWERAFRTPIEAGQTPSHDSTVTSKPSLQKPGGVVSGPERPDYVPSPKSGLQPHISLQQSRNTYPSSGKLERPAEFAPTSTLSGKPSEKPQPIIGRVEPSAREGSSTYQSRTAAPVPPMTAYRASTTRGREPGLNPPYIPVPVPKEALQRATVEPRASTSQTQPKFPPGSSLGPRTPQVNPPTRPETTRQFIEGTLPTSLVPVGYASPRSSASRSSLPSEASSEKHRSEGRSIDSENSPTREVAGSKKAKGVSEGESKGSERTLRKFTYEED